MNKLDHDFNVMTTSDRLRSLPYDFYGVKLWSVENSIGYIFKYCDTKEDAEDYIQNVEN